LTQGLNAGLEALGYENQIALAIAQLPVWAYFLVLFLVSDLISWNVHRLLHRVSWLWEFHKVHHSVEEMGFAAHVRYHWMENVVYWVVRVVPLTLLGFDLVDLFALHVLNVAWGHFNHTNITVPTWLSGSLLGMLVGLGFATLYAPDYGVGSIYVFAGLTLGALALRPLMHFLFNSPEMHIWHHAYDIPAQRRYGVNFGITLALWDYLFGTAYMPGSGRDIRLGFEGIEHFPKGLLGQLIYGFRKKKP
jgi:sterol desaturase/sphingolipid hydroxylase (fatty acid hydroxylase superfamily)